MFHLIIPLCCSIQAESLFRTRRMSLHVLNYPLDENHRSELIDVTITVLTMFDDWSGDTVIDVFSVSGCCWLSSKNILISIGQLSALDWWNKLQKCDNIYLLELQSLQTANIWYFPGPSSTITLLEFKWVSLNQNICSSSYSLSQVSAAGST